MQQLNIAAAMGRSRASAAVMVLLLAIATVMAPPGASALSLTTGTSWASLLAQPMTNESGMEPELALAPTAGLTDDKPVDVTETLSQAQAAEEPSPAADAAPIVMKAAAPASGDLIERVDARLVDQKKTINTVTEELIGVGADVDQVEQALLGRVIDADTARAITVKHEQVQQATARAHTDIKNLREQTGALTKLVAQAHKDYMAAAEAQRTAEKALEAKLAIQAQKEAVVQHQLPPLRFLAKKMTVRHKKLASENAADKMKGIAIHTELQQIMAAILSEAADEAKLRRSLVEVHNYSLACHARATTLQADVAMATKQMPKTSAAAAAAEKQGEASQRAASQRLQAEGVLIRAQIEDTETQGAHALEKLKGFRVAMSQLEQSIVDEVQNVTGIMEETKKRTALVQQAVNENIDKQSEDEGRHASLTIELHKLHERVSPVIFAALDAENQALKAEITEVTGLLAKAKHTEVQSYTNLVQTQSDKAGATAAAAGAQAALDKSQEEAKILLAKAVAETAKNIEKHNALLAKSNAAIAKKCNPEWDQRKLDVDAEIEECRKVEEELSIVNAQKETLEQTLKAQQTAASTDEDE